MKSYEDEIKSGFQFINFINDTTYLIYNDGDVFVQSSQFRESSDSTIYIYTSIIAKQKTDNQDDFYYYLNDCRTTYSFSEDTIFIFNQYSYNPDGGHPAYSSKIEVNPPENQNIIIEKRQ
jgi:hypothetical protein